MTAPAWVVEAHRAGVARCRASIGFGARCGDKATHWQPIQDGGGVFLCAAHVAGRSWYTLRAEVLR